MSVGERIKHFRVKKGMTRRTLAIAADITEGGLYKIETEERNPSFELVSKIADVLGVDLNQLRS